MALVYSLGICIITTLFLNSLFLTWSIWCSKPAWWVMAVIFLISCFLNTNFTVIFGLRNMLSGIHPFLLLSGYSCALSISFIKLWGYLRAVIYNILSISLILGGWWALQEFTWGGWWNWDSVEFPILITLIWIYFKQYHYPRNRYTYISVLQLHTIGGLMLIYIIFLTRYGNLFSVHSFTGNMGVYQLYWSFLMCGSVITMFYGLIVLHLNIGESFVFSKIVLSTVLLVGWYRQIHKTQWEGWPRHLPLTNHIMLSAVGLILILWNWNFYQYMSLHISDLPKLNNTLCYVLNWGVAWVKPETSLEGFNLHTLLTLVN
jgi:hypothetical protein